MHDHATSVPHPNPPGKARILRARSVPSARPFRVAVFFSSLHYLGLVATVAALVSVVLEATEAAVHLMVGALVFSAITWLIAFFKRRSTFCPLCKGTPLINSGARVHTRAWRFLPFNHGTTATLSIMASQKFRCMYCGSDYDLLKPRTRLLHGDVDGHDGEDHERWS